MIVEEILSLGIATVVALIIVSYVFNLVYRITSQSEAASIPRLGKSPGWFGFDKSRKDFEVNGRHIINEGYRKHKGSLFRVQSADMERIVVSPRYIDQLKNLHDVLIIPQRHLGEYTTLNVILTSSLQNDICRSQLTRNLAVLVGPMREETLFCLKSKIPKVDGGVKLPAFKTLLHITAQVSSRVFIGLPTSRDSNWLETALAYTADVFRVSSALRPYPSVVRPLIAPWLNSTKQLNERINAANRCIRPLLVERLANASTASSNQDVLQWMVEKARGVDRNPDVLVKKLLFLTLAAIHTSTMSITHILFDLCSMPKYMEALREEAREAIGKQGWTMAAINELKLLDSFMKESQRLNHPGLLSFNRKVMSPLHLSDGRVIPAGSFISMATESIARDPAFYVNPEQFDGNRFYNRRNASDEQNHQHQFVTTSAESLAFGHGKFACPGRFFASAIIKVLLVTILSEYDVSFPDGQTVRPANQFLGEGIRPDQSQGVVFSPRS